MNKETYKSYQKHWITSDIHFNHLNILKYCPESRGMYSNVDSMNEAIISRFNSKVSADDHTFILGDVAMGLIQKAPKLIERLNGHKTLVVGNHDRGLLKLERQLLTDAGVIDIQDYLAFSVNKIGVVMFHFPIKSWDGQHRGSIHFHGHLHGSPSGLTGRIKDVGADTNDLYPYDLEKLVESMTKIPAPLTNHHGQE